MNLNNFVESLPNGGQTPVAIDLPKQVVCGLYRPCEESPWPPPVMEVRWDPEDPNSLNYLSFSFGQTEDERQWTGMIPLVGDLGGLVVYVQEHPESVH